MRGEIADVTSNWLESYIVDVGKVSSTYRDRGLKVLCGLEIGYVPGIETMIEAYLTPSEKYGSEAWPEDDVADRTQ